MADQTPTVNIDLGDVMHKAAEDQFWALRGHAIQGYANLEQSLCRLMAGLMGSTDVIAAVIFFRIQGNTRRPVLEKLFKLKFQDQFNLFRNSLIEELRKIDEERNQIVHWNSATTVASQADGSYTVSVSIQPPTSLFAFDANTQSKDSASLIAFIAKCDFFARLLNIFMMMYFPNTAFSADVHEKHIQTYSGIFSQPVTYPPPADHPLLQKPQKRDSPPQHV